MGAWRMERGREQGAGTGAWSGDGAWRPAGGFGVGRECADHQCEGPPVRRTTSVKDHQCEGPPV
eukprot:366078-Chlamydomonas_euryale.AAC.11